MLKTLKLIALVFLAIPSLILGFVTANVFGRPTTDFVGEDDITVEEVMERQLIRAFSKTKDEKKLELKFDENFFNQLLYTVRTTLAEEMPEDAKQYFNLESLFTEIKGTDYNFHIAASTMFGIANSTSVYTSMEKVENFGEENKTAYVFSVKDITLGKIGILGLTSFLDLANEFELDKTVAEAMKDVPLHFHTDFSHNRVYYYEEDLWNDVRSIMSGNETNKSEKLKSASTEGSLLEGIIQMVDLDFDFIDGISASTSLADFVDNEEMTDSVNHYVGYEEKVQNVLDGALAKSKAMMKNGSSKEDAEKSFNNDIKVIRTTDVEEDETVNFLVNDRINEKANPAGIVELLTPSTEFKNAAFVTETEINNVLNSTDLVGTSFFFGAKDEAAYIVIDKIYADLYSTEDGDFLNFTIGINVNGLETRLIIQTKFEAAETNDSWSGAFSFDNESIYLGNKQVESKLADLMITFMKDAISGMADNEWIALEGNSIVINFDKLLLGPSGGMDETLKTVLTAAGVERRLNVKGVGLFENGQFEVQVRRNA